VRKRSTVERIYQKNKSERVREDESGDNKDGEDDKLHCVIGESEGDCIWRGWRRSVGSSFHRQGAACRKERLVILKEDRFGGRARVTIDEEHVLWQGWTEIKLWRYWGWLVVKTFYVRERSLYLMRSFLSRCRELRTGVMWEVTTQARGSGMFWSLFNPWLCKIIVQWVVVVTFKMNDRGVDGTCSFKVKITTNTAKYRSILSYTGLSWIPSLKKLDIIAEKSVTKKSSLYIIPQCKFW